MKVCNIYKISKFKKSFIYYIGVIRGTLANPKAMSNLFVLAFVMRNMNWSAGGFTKFSLENQLMPIDSWIKKITRGWKHLIQMSMRDIGIKYDFQTLSDLLLMAFKDDILKTFKNSTNLFDDWSAFFQNQGILHYYLQAEEGTK